MNTTISIITVNYNGLADTCEMIDSLPPYEGMEVIVVDNGSKANEAAVIAARYPHVKAIRSEQNLGFAGGNNLGIKAATGQYLFFINNDTVVRDNWHLEQLIHRLESSEKIGMVSPKIRFAWETSPIQFAGYTPLSTVTMRNHAIGFGEEDCGQYDTPHPTPYAHGAAMMAKRAAIDKAGLMPECFFLYYEELDWSMMFTRAGYEIWYDPCCTIYHKESKSTGQASPLKTFYTTRNRLLFVKRNMSGLSKCLSYLYIIGVVAPKDMLLFTLKGRFDLAKATVSGITNFIKTRE
ncbi:MAG: glycosyltransferase family 2 protein [Prevotella sp.]|nr:glycosyltransferase family 2 protein [Prevotella sp.]